MLQRAWGQGAVGTTGGCEEGHSYRKPSTTSGGGRHLLEVARRDECQASSWPSWITNQLTIRHTSFYFFMLVSLTASKPPLKIENSIRIRINFK
jgi:hypothetical protein